MLFMIKQYYDENNNTKKISTKKFFNLNSRHENKNKYENT